MAEDDDDRHHYGHHHQHTYSRLRRCFLRRPRRRYRQHIPVIVLVIFILSMLITSKPSPSHFRVVSAIAVIILHTFRCYLAATPLIL